MSRNGPRPRLLVTELWGIGDLALAMPFLKTASVHSQVALLANPQAAPLLERFAPAVELIPIHPPWTAFSGKYRLHRWPWRELRGVIRTLRARRFDAAVSARPDPRDHAMMWLGGIPRRLGFPRQAAGLLLTQPLAPPRNPHRAAHWAALARALGWPEPAAASHRAGPVRRVVIHTGAGHAVRAWPVERFAEIAARIKARGLVVQIIDARLGTLESLLDTLAATDAFIGNDSGPGHLAALLGLPTFTVFSSQLPERFSPVHPRAGWIEGRPCPHKPCSDACRYAVPHCLLDLDAVTVGSRIETWLASL